MGGFGLNAHSCMLFATLLVASASIIASAFAAAAAKQATMKCVESMTGHSVQAASSSNGTSWVAQLQTILSKAGLPTGPIDGRFGYRTIRALQAYLLKGGYNVGPIDGRCGWRTIRALQMWLTDLGADPGPIDGRWGRRTTVAMQRAVDSMGDPRVDPPVVSATPVPVVGEAVAEGVPMQFPTSASDEENVVVMGTAVDRTSTTPRLYPPA